MPPCLASHPNIRGQRPLLTPNFLALPICNRPLQHDTGASGLLTRARHASDGLDAPIVSHPHSLHLTLGARALARPSLATEQGSEPAVRHAVPTFSLCGP